MIIVHGSIETKAECTEDAIAISLVHVERSRLEPGCLTHDIHIDIENKQRIVFYEEWESVSALQVHFKVPESGEFVKAVTELATSAPSMKIYHATSFS